MGIVGIIIVGVALFCKNIVMGITGVVVIIIAAIRES